MRGYKLVRKLYSDEKCSAYEGGYGRVLYAEGKDTVPDAHCGPLLLFTNKRALQKFMRFIRKSADLSYWDSHEVWKCEYDRSTFTFAWTPNFETALSLFPRGSALASRIRLLSRVERW